MRGEIKDEAPQVTLQYCGSTVRSSHKSCSQKLCNISTENTCVGVSFKKIASLKACNFIKKRSQHRYFLVNIAKFLRLPISKTICDRILFNCFSGSLLHGLKVSRSKLHDGVRLQSLSHRSSFLFSSRHLSS